MPATMSPSQVSALSAYPSPYPRNPDPIARRRRTSVSGKLLSLFASSKPKSDTAHPAQAQRPVISRPQPLERNASSTRVPTHAHTSSARRKRNYAEASGDENDDSDDRPTRDDRHHDGPRASSRPRLDSDASTHTVRPSQPVPPLKSALKKPAVEPETRTSKGLLSARFSHTRAKAALKTSSGHNRGASAPPSSFALFQDGARDRPLARAIVSGATSYTPSTWPTARATTSACNRDIPKPSGTKKTVTFAKQEKMTLKRAPTLRHIPDTDHWLDLAIEIEGFDAPTELLFSSLDNPPSPPYSRPSSPQPKSRPNSPRRKSEPVFTLAPAPRRTRKSLPVPPVVSTSAINARAAVAGNHKADARSCSQFRYVLARQAPPTPEATLKPFRLPGATGANKQREGSGAAREKENGIGASGILEDVLKEIARDSAEREQERSAREKTQLQQAQSACDRVEREQERGRSTKKRAVLPTVSGSRAVRDRFSVDLVPNARHTTLWDGKETDIYAWQGTLEIHDTKPPSYFYPRHLIHDVTIQFHTADEPREDPVTFDPTPFTSSSTPPFSTHEWQTSYSGTRLPSTFSTSPISGTPTLDPSRGIALEYAPQLQPSDNPDGPCTWTVRFWVPVPLRLFARAEHRTFVCRAKVTMRDWETPTTVVPGGCVVVGMERLRTKQLFADGGAPMMAF
ncbi:uncharacterized protein TRAVEDRAFT_54321 [Trametes versicolor FP-101664 SS1]|uniref:Uncharacterized protein n=1 Tax=Trametes versicolor (strain FP-101664) TaxID=717944 RepID=R7S876_TRAVS|nr:uncharacterized protein TRAVEDRAFT_54321 [Trametes versicolor FP-101664 SS1]EIW51905.1 hypothetical protein TRAVEDRAFT_54321 [Trametes versicolor FP-101664 SS1]